MEPYVILGTIVSFIAFVDLTSLKRSRFLYFMLFSILVIFVGTRDHIGTDWWIYEGLFSGRDQSSLIEPGYRLLEVFTKTIGGNDFRYMVFTTSLISIGIKFDAFRKLSPLVYVSVLFYFGYYYIPQEANQVRQGLAAGILLFSIPNLLSGRIYKFLSVVLIAASFHVSSLVFLVCPFLLRLVRVPTYFIVGFLIVSTVFMFVDIYEFWRIVIEKIVVNVFKVPIIQEKLVDYIGSRHAEKQGFYVGSLFLLFFFSLFASYRKKINQRLFDFLFVSFSFGVVLNFLFNSLPVLGRLTFHFILLGSILYSMVVKAEKRVVLKVLYIFILSVISLGKIANYVSSEKGVDYYIPYKSFILP